MLLFIEIAILYVKRFLLYHSIAAGYDFITMRQRI